MDLGTSPSARLGSGVGLYVEQSLVAQKGCPARSVELQLLMWLLELFQDTLRAFTHRPFLDNLPGRNANQSSAFSRVTKARCHSVWQRENIFVFGTVGCVKTWPRMRLDHVCWKAEVKSMNAISQVCLFTS